MVIKFEDLQEQTLEKIKDGGFVKGIFVFLAFLGMLSVFLYYSLMVNVGPNKVAIVMEYRGSSPPVENGFIATESGQMGIQLDVWREGLHFVNPIFTQVQVMSIVHIPENNIGHVVRKYGKDLPPGKITAGDGEKGVLDIALKPGFYPQYSNTFAYEVTVSEAIVIPRGSVGVVTNLTGSKPETPNQFLSNAGERGVQKQHLTPGTYFLNPYTKRVDLVSIQSKRTDIEDIQFPSFDGFPITLNSSIEWIVPEENAPITFVRFGNEQEVEDKIINPITLNYSRIIGSNSEATSFIGKAREKFGNEFQQAISQSIKSVSVEIKETGIRTIRPPQEVLAILQDKQIAVQQKLQYQQEIIRNGEESKLKVQETKAIFEKTIVDKNTDMLKQLLDRQRAQDVAVLDAQKELDAALIQLEAARNIADASRTLARAEADATLFGFLAEAKAQSAAVRAFGNGENAALDYSRYMLTKSMAPRIDELFTGTEILNQGMLFGKEVAR